MKKFVLKIRNKRLKGNVSLLVIFVLLASSVISLLSINQIQRLLSYGNMTFNYFRAFYLAKAWTELWLTEVYYREAGFEQKINSWDTLVAQNLVWIYTGFNPYFDMSISWNFQYLTNDVRYSNECSGDNKIVLGSWEWIMLYLFTDETKGLNDMFTWTKDKNIKPISNAPRITINPKRENNKSDGELTFWLFSYENDEMTDIIVETMKSENLGKFLSSNTVLSNKDRRKYLTIKNPYTWDEKVEFCVYMEGSPIPSPNSLITVQANYGDMEVWLESVVRKDVPDWTLNVID